MTRTHKTVLVAAGSVFAAFFLALLLIPLLFRDRIEAALRDQVEQRASVRVGWDDVGLSLLRAFPHVTLSVDELTVVGTGPFETDTLVAVARARVALDVGSAVRAVRGRGPLVVRSVRLTEPAIDLVTLEDGRANWDFLRSRVDGTAPEEPPGARGFALELRGFEVTDGSLRVDDARSGVLVSAEGIRHSLSGDFSRETLVARARGHVDRASVTFAGVPYLSEATVDLDAQLDVDVPESRVRFLDNDVRVNGLALAFSGDAARVEDAITLDVQFAAPRTEFSEILSLVPVIWASDFETLETSGGFTLEGWVRGAYRPGSLPAFGLEVTVADGTFRYPDLPLAARSIAVDLSVEGPGGDADATVLTVRRFGAEIDGQLVEGALTLRTPLSDPDFDLRVSGEVDLADLARTVKVEALEGVTGTVAADAAVRARRSDLENAGYDSVDAEGTLVARAVTLSGERLRHPVRIDDADLRLSPARAELRSFSATFGGSDVQATGSLDNLLAFALGAQPLRGRAAFTSERVVLDEWRSGRGLSAIPVPPNLDLTLDGVVAQLTLGALEMANARGRARVSERQLTLEGFTFETLGGRVGLDGRYETTDITEPTFAFDVVLDSLDVSQASAALQTVRTFAPVSRFARGAFSADLDVSGALRPDLSPVLERLDGNGSVATSEILIEGFPLLERLAEAVAVPRLARPTVEAVRSSVRIQGGRLHVEPFLTSVAGLGMTVSGSNGIDQSVDYTLGLTLPRSGLGDLAERRVQDLMTRAGLTGAAAVPDSVRVAVAVTGTISDPQVGLRLGETVGSTRALAAQAAEAAVQQRVDEAQQRLDEAEEAARARARAQADSIVADAETRAEQIRAEARRAAERIRSEGDRAAEELLSRATTPVARVAAQPAAERIRREANERADAVVREADAQATALVDEARRRAESRVGPSRP